LRGVEKTLAVYFWAILTVSSVEPPSTTIISIGFCDCVNSETALRHSSIVCSLLNVVIIIDILSLEALAILLQPPA
jgi:hypothetical protein